MEDDFQGPSREELAKRLLAARRWLIPRLEVMLGKDGSAEDVAQEAGLKALEAAPLSRSDNFEGWLWSVAKHMALDCLRKRLREQRGLNQLPEVLAAPAAPDVLLLAARAKEVWKTLEDMPAGQRICLKLHYIEDKSYDEIAALTGFPKEQVRAHVQNGKIKFRKLWRTIFPEVQAPR